MDPHVERLLANKVIGWVYHPDKHKEVLVAKGTGCEVQSPDTDYRPRQRPINYPRELRIDPDIYRIESFVFEGLKQHMYLDHNRNVTVGLGHMIKDVDAAKKLPFYDRKTKLPIKDDDKWKIEEEFNQIRKPKYKKYNADDFRKVTNLDLDPVYIENQFKADVKEFIRQLRAKLTEFDTYPKMAQLGLLDLIFNLGHDRFFGKGKFTGFPKLLKALRYRNWKEVAKESHRKEKNDKGVTMGGVVKRNIVVRDWFLTAGREDPFFVDPNCGPAKNVSALVG